MTDVVGKVTFEALDKKALDARKAALHEAYKKAVKEAEGTDTKPVKPAAVILKEGIAEKAKAEAEAAKLREAYQKQLKEKEATAERDPPKE